MKKWISIFLSAAFVFSFTACGTEAAVESIGSAEANMTYDGTVSAISSQSITVSGSNGETVIKLSDSTTVSRDFDMPGDRPQMDGGPSGGNGLPDGQRETPPEKPSEPSGNSQDAPPEPPQGEASNPMGGQPQSLTIADISVGDTVTVKTDGTGTAESILLSGGGIGTPEKPDGAMGGPGSIASGVDSYDAVTAFPSDAEESGGTYRSTGTDENAIHVSDGASVTLEDASILRESDSSTGGDTSSFYGVGAAALVTDGSLSVGNSTIESDASGGTGVFAYGDGTAYVWDTAIDTRQNTSGGIHVAGGGTLYAWDLTVETDGESSAAIRSDRGSGTMVVDGGSYTSNGLGSPAIYSAADITVHNAALTATGSEAICIEGFNTIRLFDCDLTGDMEDLSQNDCTWNVILYQSMSGDSQIGNSTFEMIGGSLTAGNGGMFYTTNTESTFLLSGVDITYAQDSDFFLKCTGNANQRGWGRTGSNGADCSFTGIAQQMQGDILWDTISQLDFYVTEGSTLTGAVINDESNAGSGGSGYAALYVDFSSTWTVTGDSRLTSLHCAGTITDPQGNAVTVQGIDGTVYVQGSSPYTVTVDTYDGGADCSGASSAESWNDFAIAKP